MQRATRTPHHPAASSRGVGSLAAAALLAAGCCLVRLLHMALCRQAGAQLAAHLLASVQVRHLEPQPRQLPVAPVVRLLRATSA
jgi:hypothetical protein